MLPVSDPMLPVPQLPLSTAVASASAMSASAWVCDAWRTSADARHPDAAVKPRSLARTASTRSESPVAVPRRAPRTPEAPERTPARRAPRRPSRTRPPPESRSFFEPSKTDGKVAGPDQRIGNLHCTPLEGRRPIVPTPRLYPWPESNGAHPRDSATILTARPQSPGPGSRAQPRTTSPPPSPTPSSTLIRRFKAARRSLVR